MHLASTADQLGVGLIVLIRGRIPSGEEGRDVDSALELVSCATPIPLQGHTSPINDVVTWGDLLFSASDDKTVRIWDLASDQ
ncbi:hypothetical protein T484DRAFT_1769416 [Baffinella frigidus]|nr:hypothetical protein T484DRAFT_1769416 [Cryptophyta sp. CCMP2293]